MRKMNRSAFTLVELIVVITILAILGTIAFISLGGNVTKAKNAKVGQDINSLLSKINIVTTQDKTLNDVMKEGNTFNAISSTSKVNSGSTINSGTTVYKVGTVNFVALGEKQSDFQYKEKDQNRDYVFAYVVDKDFVKYEMAGNTYDQAGNPTVVLKGNYYQVDTTNDTKSLISASGSEDPVVSGDPKNLY